MAISDRPILDPDPPRPGIPLRKSTLAVLALLLLGVGLASSMVLSTPPKSAVPTPLARDVAELKKTGSEQAIKDEEAEAARSADRAARLPRASSGALAAASAATVPATHAAVMPAGLPPLPASVRRSDNASAFFDPGRAASNRGGARTVAAGAAGAEGSSAPFPPGSPRNGDLELEAQTRMAKALVYDLEAPANDSRPPLPPRLSATATLGDGALRTPSAEPPSVVVDAQIDALRKQLAGAQPTPARGKDEWLREYAREADGQHVLGGYQAPRRLVLRQGKVIPAVLGRQINSDLPGRITAYVSSDVFDAAGALLIPKGAALVGRYDAGVQVGQSRLMFAFQRLILPNGFSFDLPAAAGSDLAGAAGMSGEVDNHFLKMFGTSLLIAVLADRVKQPANVTQFGSSGPVTAAGQVLTDVSKTVLERNRVIPPTITVDQGTRINVEVVADMVFPQAYPRQ